jgi:hypothetical protein
LPVVSVNVHRHPLDRRQQTDSLPSSSNITSEIFDVRRNGDNVVALALILLGTTAAQAEFDTVPALVITPSEMRWNAQGAYAEPGME